MKNTVTLFIIFSLLIPVLALASNIKPPTSTVIYQTLNDHWKDGRFDELDSYISELRNSWGDYLPVRLAYATYSYKCQVKVDEAISVLEDIQLSLKRDLFSTSPVFMELLDSTISQYMDIARYYSKRGYNRDYLLKKLAPRKMDPSKRSKEWGDEMLYFNAPEVFLNATDVIPAHPERPNIPDFQLQQKGIQQLLQSLSDDKLNMCTRKAVVKKIVQKRKKEGNLKQLARGLDEAHVVYTYRETVDELASAGQDAVPIILEALNDPFASNTDKKYAIWALVRVGVVTKEVVQTLQTIAEDSEHAEVADYAKQALENLQER